jgi:hypothetical protein
MDEQNIFLALNNGFKGKNAQFGTGKRHEQIDISLREISGISSMENW